MKNPETVNKFENQELSTISLLPDILNYRDPSTRFSDEEKTILASTMSEAWKSFSSDRSTGETISLNNTSIQNGKYPNEAPMIWVTKKELDPNRWQYIDFPLEKDSDLVGLTTYLWQKNVNKCILGSFDFPSQLGDRNMSIDEVFEEGMVIGSYMRNLSAHHTRGIFLYDNHSPVTSLLALKNGIRIVDLSTLPLLLNTAIEHGWVNPHDKIVVSPFDDGARERGKLIHYLLSSQHYNTTFVQGEKIKSNGHKVIKFKEEDKIYFKNASVVVPEDRLVSGGTIVQGLCELYSMGAKSATILVPYAECINGAAQYLKEFVDEGRLRIVITDGTTPRASLDDLREGLQIVPIRPLTQQVFKLDQQGVNFWEPDGREALAQLGIAHNPWQTMH